MITKFTIKKVHRSDLKHNIKKEKLSQVVNNLTLQNGKANETYTLTIFFKFLFSSEEVLTSFS